MKGVGQSPIAPWGVKSWGVRESQVAEWTYYVPDAGDEIYRQSAIGKRVAERGSQEQMRGNERGGGLQFTSLAEEPATSDRDRCRRVRRARRWSGMFA